MLTKGILKLFLFVHQIRKIKCKNIDIELHEPTKSIDQLQLNTNLCKMLLGAITLINPHVREFLLT